MCSAIHSFKKHINSDRPIQNPLFSYGKRRSQILHTRIRTNCSALNEHLFRRNVVASPLCQCGQRESPFHYFFEWQLYINIRAELLDTISIHSVPSVQMILYGDSILDYQTNTNIADAVHTYIINSKNSFDSERHYNSLYILYYFLLLSHLSHFYSTY